MASQMTYQNMRIQHLPAAVIIDNFIRGIGKYSYEDYLREIVNSSKFFLNKSNGKEYHKPPKESNREPDCISDKYTLDFKLFAAQTRCKADSLFSSQIVSENGITSYGAPKMTREKPNFHPIPATRIYVAFRNLSMNELYAIRCREDGEQNSVQSDVKGVLETLEVCKNLFLFFPYNINFDVNDDFEWGKKLALQGINDDFRDAMRYRVQVCPGLDTYFCFLYAQHFVICEWCNDEFECVDMLPIEKSPLFIKLIELADEWSTRGYLK